MNLCKFYVGVVENITLISVEITFINTFTYCKLIHICILPEHKIHEIRTRAINNVQSKFQSCRTDLQDLVVDVHDLIQHLMKWFDLKPVTNVKQIFEILLILLKVNYMQLHK